MNKHEEFQSFIMDLREKNINFYEDAAPFFIGYLSSVIERSVENGESSIQIENVVKAMKSAYDFALGVY